MTEYTIVNGKPVAKGKGKKPINLKEVAKSVATLSIPSPIAKEVIKKIKKKDKKKDKFTKKTLPKIISDLKEELPKGKKGGPVRKNKGGPVDARKIAKKYFKGIF
jgi:hypothetical protein